MISHGYSVKEYDDPIVDIVEAAVSQFSECVEPGAYLVDMVPLCKSLFLCWPVAGGINHVSHSLSRTGMCHTVQYVPNWFPGAGWKVKAKRFADTLTEMADVPHQFVKDQMVSRRSSCSLDLLPLPSIPTCGCSPRGRSLRFGDEVY